MTYFSGRVAAITGASSGIGRALAEALAAEGCALALSDVDAEGLAETRVACESQGVRVSAATVDVSDREAMHAWADACAETHGAVHAIFNNAGVALASSVESLSYEDLEWIFGINFWGVVHGTKAFLPHLRESGRGDVVNISSVFGMIAVPSQGAYNATKFAVRGYTEALRQELQMEGAPVRASVVCPGGIQTNIARSARMRLGGSEATHARRAKAFERGFITPPAGAATTILRGVSRGRARILIGPDARIIDALVRALPSGYARVTRSMAKRFGM